MPKTFKKESSMTITFKRWCGRTQHRNEEWRVYINGFDDNIKRYIGAEEASGDFVLHAPQEDRQAILNALQEQFGLGYRQKSSFMDILNQVSDQESLKIRSKLATANTRVLKDERPVFTPEQAYQSQMTKTREFKFEKPVRTTPQPFKSQYTKTR